MNSIKEWLKPGLGLKRWIFLTMCGIASMVYSLSTILVENTPEINKVVWMVIFFVIGFCAVVYSIIQIQKRTLEIFVESSSAHKKLDEKNIDIKSLIYNKDIFDDGAKVVVISGGSGLNTVISGLKKYTNNITAIVTLSDYHEDKSRKRLNTLPYSDIKESLVALSDDPNSMKKLLDLNFSSRSLEGLNFGDIFLLAMQESYGNIPLSIKKSGDVLNIVGDVIPCSADEIKVCAELTDGSVVETKEQIPKKVLEKLETIKRIYLNPTNARVTPTALKAIEEADLIVIGPGNLYTNIIPNLLVKHISQTIKESKAVKVYLANIMTDKGQTDGYTLSQHIKAIFDHSAGKIFDYVIADTGDIIPEYLRTYHKEGEDLVEIDDAEIKKLGIKLIQKDVSKISEEGRIRHDGESIATYLMEILMSDLKYQESTNRSEKIKKTLLDAVLKKERKKERQKQKIINKARRKGLKDPEIIEKLEKMNKEKKNRASKFKEKYSNRMENIKEEREKIEKELEEEKTELTKSEKEKIIFERTKGLLDKAKEEIKEDIKQEEKIQKKSDKSIKENINLSTNKEKQEIDLDKISKAKPSDDLFAVKENELSDSLSSAEILKSELEKLEKFRQSLKKDNEYKD